MTDWDDADDVLHRFVSSEDADRLLAGDTDALEGDLAPMVGLFAALREQGRPAEMADVGELAVRSAAMVRTRVATAAAPSRRKPMIAKVLTGKVAAIAVATLFTAGAAAAATGNLPDPVQRSVTRVFTAAGDQPKSSVDGKQAELDESTTTAASTTTGASTTTVGGSTTSSLDGDEHAGVGPDATGPAKHGLCTAYHAGGEKNLEATAFHNLVQAATDAGQSVDDFCAAETDGSSTTTTEATSTESNHGRPQSPGLGGTPAATSPAATAPGVTAPGATAPSAERHGPPATSTDDGSQRPPAGRPARP